MKQYHVVFSSDLDKFKSEVQKRINDGWKLVGGISITTDEDNYYFVQAMIKI